MEKRAHDEAPISQHNCLQHSDPTSHSNQHRHTHLQCLSYLSSLHFSNHILDFLRYPENNTFAWNFRSSERLKIYFVTPWLCYRNEYLVQYCIFWPVPHDSEPLRVTYAWLKPHKARIDEVTGVVAETWDERSEWVLVQRSFYEGSICWMSRGWVAHRNLLRLELL